MTPVGQYFYQHGQDLLANYNLLIDQTKQIGEREKDNYTLKLGYLRGAPSNKYVNEYLTSSSFEIVINKRLVRGSKKITSHELAEFPYILIVGNSEKDSELEYCRTVLGIESNFKLVETYDEALMQVISGADIF